MKKDAKIIELESYCHNNKEYKIDGVNVKQNNSLRN